MLIQDEDIAIPTQITMLWTDRKPGRRKVRLLCLTSVCGSIKKLKFYVNLYICKTR